MSLPAPTLHLLDLPYLSVTNDYLFFYTRPMHSITKVLDSFIDINLHYLIREMIGFVGVSESIASQVRNHLIEVDRRFRLLLVIISVLVFPERFFHDNFKHINYSRTTLVLRKLPLVNSAVQLIHTISMMIALREKN